MRQGLLYKDKSNTMIISYSDTDWAVTIRYKIHFWVLYSYQRKPDMMEKQEAKHSC